MFFTQDIRWDESIDEPDKITAALANGTATFNVYLVCVAKRGVIEILSCYNALKEVNRPDELTVIAAAKGKARAEALLADILLEWQKQHGSLTGFIPYYK